jgi:hypothetical protein
MTKPTRMFLLFLAAGTLSLSPSNAQIQYTTPGEAFPLAIGNRWYYRHHDEISTFGVYTLYRTVSITREIVDTTADGTRLVRVLDEASLKADTDHWSYNGVVLSSPDPGSVTTFSFIPTVLWDSSNNPMACRRGVLHLFGNDYVSWTWNWGGTDPLGGWSESVAGASGVGIFAMVYSGGHSGVYYTYREDLQGMCLGGVVYGDTAVIRTGVEPGPEVPVQVALDQNYPNPFNPSTTIRYALPRRSHVSLAIFNLLGQQVAALVNESQDAGYHHVLFDGNGLASGVYLYRLQSGNYVTSKRLVLIR